MNREKVAVITGGSSGIGLSTAIKFAKEGYSVAIIARDPERLQKAYEQIRLLTENISMFSADVSDLKKLKEIFRQIDNEYKSIDILVNCAGVMPLSFISDYKVKEWNSIIDINIKGTMNSTASVLPYLKRNNKGHIVNLGSILSYTAEPYGVVYSASKHAIKAITDGLRKELELEKSNIYLTLISPGPVETGLVKPSKFKVKMLPPDSIADIIYSVTCNDSFKSITELIVKP